MIKLATPISHLFLHTQNAREIVMVSDCLECRDWCIEEQHPKEELIHFDFNIIHHWPEAMKLRIRSSILSKPMLKLVTFHMAACCGAPVEIDGMFQPGGMQYCREELLENARVNILWIRSFLAEKTIIAVENNNYYPTPAYDYITDGDFIAEVVEENDIKFLLDIAHARITAHNRAINYKKYLATLPLKDTIQIHISSHRINSARLAYDAHEFPDEGIYREVRSLVKAYPVKYLTVEYYKDSTKVVRALRRYSQLKQDINR
ncbi:MAG: DUF692 family protein [Deltaproteobacteria bacterium]|nr:DUF692 family protein [Deltaproteobacteria bacterium]MBW2116683.1 DUF692 family protein [Deltaproteobacteria bacterium]MBW2342991.1 DUF692 family protein [Deltaproteobacteria bacterium]